MDIYVCISTFFLVSCVVTIIGGRFSREDPSCKLPRLVVVLMSDIKGDTVRVCVSLSWNVMRYAVHAMCTFAAGKVLLPFLRVFA